jgi:L-aspartate oxidase
MRFECDYLVVGGGVAGLTFALDAAEHGEVVIVTKRDSGESATAKAQGGIAAVLDPRDSFEAHVADTLATGYGLSKPDIVEMVVRDGPARIRELVAIGARFSTRSETDERLDLTREGGHSARRVVHAGDITGRELQRALVDAANEHARIRFLEHHMAIDLIELSRFGGARRVVGAYVLDEREGAVHTFLARATVLATGGAGKVYLYTSNPDVATGDGVAMAYRAGARIANMEFFQFHPTCLFHPKAKSFLISEAMRGEGGILRLADGTAVMERHHPMKDLAPRDVVARTIDLEMKRTGDECVFLDMSARSPEYLRDRFPNIHQQCLAYGVDLTREPIPVVPAAHYMCGGVLVDGDGRSSLPGLWAVGEVTCSGLHGANRLASNSLLEGLVFGHRAALSVAKRAKTERFPEVRDWDVGSAVASDEEIIVAHNWDELRRFMWNYVGIVRTDKRLRRAARRIALLQEEIREYYWRHLVTRDLLELRNIADVAEVIISCAAARHESRGLHFTLDHPDRDDAQFGADTVVTRDTPAHVPAPDSPVARPADQGQLRV